MAHVRAIEHRGKVDGPVCRPARGLSEDQHLLDVLVVWDDLEEVDVHTVLHQRPGIVLPFDQSGLLVTPHVGRVDDLGVFGAELAVDSDLHVGGIAGCSSPICNEVAFSAAEVVELRIWDVQGIGIDLLIACRPRALD